MNFNTLLLEAGISPEDVCLLRHKDTDSKCRMSLYELWRTERAQFELYQSIQKDQPLFKSNYWASFVVGHDGETLFVGLYRRTGHSEQLKFAIPYPHKEGSAEPEVDYKYALEYDPRLDLYEGRLVIDWGSAKLSWCQYAQQRHSKPKQVIELRRAITEPEFPGYINLIEPLSRLAVMPSGWKSRLSQVKGIYLLTCPRTNEKYVGSATGLDGFWGRWKDYIATGHGGNEVLKKREPSDYQFTILEVVSSSATTTETIQREHLWMQKLNSINLENE